MNGWETFTASTSPISDVSHTTEVRQLAARTRPPTHQGDSFAAAASGLGGIRDSFYGGTGRMPNARKDASRRDRNLSGGSGNRHLGALDLWTEREISRHLYEESDLFEGIITTWGCETIQCGFNLTPKTGEDDLNTVVKEALFGHDGDGGWFAECDSRKMLHFWELLTLAEETEIVDGDTAFALDPTGNEGRGSIRIVEADRILTPTGYVAPAGRRMHHGVECEKRSGAPVRIFVADEAPAYCHCTLQDGGMFPVFDPKKPGLGGILFSVRPKRYSSSRRQPYLSTSVRGHDEMKDVFVATRIALRNEACRSTYTKIDNFDDYMAWLTTVDPSTTGVAPEEALEHTPNPGDHPYLNPGEDMAVLEAARPSNTFEAFMKMNMRFVGLPLGMCLEETVRIFDRNLSASRLGLQGTRRRYTRRQKALKRHKVNPVVEFAVACLQDVKVLANDQQTISRMACRFPVWPFIEPLKDVKAKREMRDLGAISTQTISEEAGYTYDDEKEQLKTEGPIVDAAATYIIDTEGQNT